MLSNLYYAFDRLVDKFGIYKVETIGDGYMLAAGKNCLSQIKCSFERTLLQSFRLCSLSYGPRSL